MSRSISMVRHSPQRGKASSQNPKDSGLQIASSMVDNVEDSSQKERPRKSKKSKWMPVLTALIGMIGTIGVTFISIVPQLRRGDAEEIKVLKQDLDLLKAKTVPPVPSASPDKKLTISGTVQTEGGGRPLSGVDVFLLPDSNNILTTQTDDLGRFSLPGIPAGTYSIIIRDSTQGKSGKVRLDESENETFVKMMGARIKYNIRQ